MEYYLWLKAFHIISMVAWMAGMLYLPRLFVYHASVQAGSERSEMLKVMERKLLRYIINPAMVATFIFGIWMAVLNWDYLRVAGWFYTKIGLLVLMTGFHGFLARWRRHFANDDNRHTEKFYRLINEIPTLLMIAIVILAVTKPY